ncbi:MAG: methylated-DNA--[protein]-cysteine S-methyltransferase [Rhodothermaceae bacterium]|nr:methylated-DNA--[protein]-cysteine S-methyltransferase [Rhodothermaceae bacterium]
MLAAFLCRDAAYDGLFFTGVRTTGIFCRPTCSARKPKPENVEFFPSTGDALGAGYRPCLRCHPMEPSGHTPDWLHPLLTRIEETPLARVRDRDLVTLGLDPGRVRRWFQRNHGMTFHAYQRARRLGCAFEEIQEGRNVTTTAFDHGFESLSGFHSAFARFTGASPTQTKDRLLIHVTRILTPLGPMMAAASETALHLLEFTDRRMLETQLERLGRRTGAVLAPGTNALLEQTQTELAEYFDGDRTAFTIPLSPAATAFQTTAWLALQAIPFGETRSYADQASMLGRPTAVRAVARANGDNPIAIIVPCHRVVGSDGKLTGYGGGLHRKQFLLDLERRVAGKDVQLSML